MNLAPPIARSKVIHAVSRDLSPVNCDAWAKAWMSSIGSGRLRPRRAKKRFHILEKELATTTLVCISAPQAQDKFYARVLHSASQGPLPASCFDPEKGASSAPAEGLYCDLDNRAWWRSALSRVSTACPARHLARIEDWRLDLLSLLRTT